jgi:hypothetical protein
VRVPEVVNVCVPVMVNHGVPVGACVRACVRACEQQETGQYTQVSSVRVQGVNWLSQNAC